MKTANQRLAEVRIALNFQKKADFAEKIGIERSAYDKMEKGPHKPSADSLEKIITAFSEVNLNWILTGHGPMLFLEGVETEKPGPTGQVVSPPTVERETLPPGDAPGHLKIVRLSYEELLVENADLHRKLQATTGQVVDMLTQEVKRLRKPLTSSEAADTRKAVDAIATEIPAALYEAPGFKWGIHRKLA